MFPKEKRSDFDYWFAHWAAFQMTALNCRCWKFKYLFHDIEKPFLKLFLPYKKVQTLHRRYHKHHPEWLEHKLNKWQKILSWQLICEFMDEFDYEAAIIDWECGHYTKIAQPRDAYDEYEHMFEFDNFSEKYPFITRYCYEEFSARLKRTIIDLF